MSPSSLKHHLLDEVFSQPCSFLSLRQMSCRPLPAWEVSAVRQVWELWCCLLLLLPWESLSLMEEILSQVMHNCELKPSFTCMFVSLLMLGEFPLLSWSKICTPLASSDSPWTLRVWMNICFFFLVLSPNHIISSPSSPINKNIFLNLSLEFTDQSFYVLYSALNVFCFYVSFPVLYFSG